MSGSDRIVLHERFEIPAPQPGDFAYVRVVQQDGGVLWSSPVWFEAQKEK